jgi:hypothetical protein
MQALQAQNGIGNQSSVFNQLQGVANGTGPNPAQAMLAQSTGANTANQAALMAGQRGAGANVGLLARQAAQQGGANQQAAAGQAATMQANQSLGALNQLGGIAGQQVGQQAAATGALTGAQQSEQGLLYNQISNQNNANVAMTTDQNKNNLAQAQSGAQAQGGALGGIGAAFGMARGGVVPGIRNYADGNPGGDDGSGVADPTGPNLNTAQPTFGANDNSQSISNTQNIRSATPIANAPKAPPKPQSFSNPFAATKAGSGQQQPTGAQLGGNAIGSAIGKGLKGLGSAIGGLFGGSSSDPSSQNNSVSANASDPTAQAGYSSAPADQVGGTSDNPDWSPAASQGASGQSGMDSVASDSSAIGDLGFANGGMASEVEQLAPLAMMAMARGGKVPAMVSPGERYLPPNEVQQVAQGKKSPLQAGERIPGKAKVKGDSLKNDTVPKTLEEGGIVLPRSVMESKHPHWAAHKFVSNILAQQGQLHSKRDKKRG